MWWPTWEGMTSRTNIASIRGQMVRSFRQREGFTFLEVLLALLVLGLISTSLLELFSFNLKKEGETETRAVALGLAQEKLEELIEERREKGFSHLIEENYPPEEELPSFPLFSRSISIDSLGPGLKQIEVVVKKGGKKLSLITLMGDY